MQILKTINSEGFRWAASFAVLFLALATTLIATVLWIVDDSQTTVLLRANDSDIDTIRNGFRAEGIDEAVEVISQRLGTADTGRSLPAGIFMLIEDHAKGKVAGNLPAFAARTGVFTAPGTHILGRGVFLTGEIYVFVGRDTEQITATRQRIVDAFGWIVAASFLIAGVVGAVLRNHLMRRVDDVTRTCEGIMAGRFNERIPVRGHGDALERLSGAINEMLNRIAALLENLRQVSSDVAHDLRTPLTRLRNRLEAARGGAVTSDDYAAAVSRAIDDTDQVLAIFAALLRISQIEAGTRAASFVPVSLSALLHSIVDMYRPVAEDNEQVLVANIGVDVEIRGDAELLTQMFSNLIENAIHHTPPHTIIRVLLVAEPPGIVASISDDGPGIPPDERPKVLRRFYRLSSNRGAVGHGLGLALVAAIANLHHATLQLEDAYPGLCVRTIFIQERRD